MTTEAIAAGEVLERCPACGADLREHIPGDAEDYEAWSFECGAEVFNMDGTLTSERNCGRALVNAAAPQTPAAGDK